MLPLRDHNPPPRFPFVTWILIAANVFVFWMEISAPNVRRFILEYGLVPENLEIADFFSAMFLHGGWFHLISNMWFLHIFGDNVEDRLGKIKYLLFYLASGVVAGLAQYTVDPTSTIPMIGASGAVAGVLGAYILFFPRHTVDTLVPIFYFIQIMRLPAIILIGYWFVTQLFAGVGSLAVNTAATGGIAFFAHIGGFLTGAVLAQLFSKKQI